MSTPRCEHRDTTVRQGPCGAKARWLVARGRSYDAQLSCGRHLAATCSAVMSSDRLHVTVTDVSRIKGRAGA